MQPADSMERALVLGGVGVALVLLVIAALGLFEFFIWLGGHGVGD